MSNLKTVSTGVIAVLPLVYGLGQPAEANTPKSTAHDDTVHIAQLIEPVVGATQTTITTQGQYTRIEGGTQTNNNLFHQFDTFNVETGHTADFVTAAGIQAVIGQVSGGHASYLDGTLQVSGSSADLYLINPAGILLGPNTQLNVGGGFTAATADQVGFGDEWLEVASTQDYRAFAETPSAYQFTTPTPGSVVNQADLAVEKGQSIQLIGGNIVNTGRLTAPAGNITLTAVPGESLVRLDTAGALLNIEISTAPRPTAPTAISPLSLPALLTGEAADTVTDLHVHSDGSVSLVNSDTTTNGSHPHSTEPVLEGSVAPGNVVLAGKLETSSSAEGDIGGTIDVFGAEINAFDAELYSEGNAGGGLIRVGGDYQGKGSSPTAENVSFDGIASVDAIARGDGGRIVIWSDGVTAFSGELSARGSEHGAGGFVETSGQAQLVIDDSARVVTDSPSGDLGTWLLDPTDLTVSSSNGTTSIIGGINTPVGSSLNETTLVSALNGTNVTLQATNSLTVNTDINTSGNVAAGNLTLQAPTLNLNDTIELKAGSLLTGTATIVNLGENGRLQNAVDAVATGGTVNLAAATYTGGETFINRTVRLQGQGSNRTRLDGQNTHRLITISGGDVTIDSVDIYNGRAHEGAGIWVNAPGSLALSNSVLDNNRAETGQQFGGGLAFTGLASSSIADSTLRNNYAGVFGGGIRTSAGHQLSVDRTTFENNSAGVNGGAIDRESNGGAFRLRDSRLTGNSAITQNGGAISMGGGTGLDSFDIERSLFIGNFSAAMHGGAISAQGAELNITDSIFAFNEARGAGLSLGGAISARGTVSISNSRFENNSAAANGGAISLTANGTSLVQNTTLDNNQSLSRNGGAIAVQDQHQLTIENSTLSNNSAVGEGGGVYNNSSSATGLSVNTSTLSGNSANFGGGLAIGLNATTTLTHTTVANNTANFFGGGIRNLSGISGLRLTNTIVATNTSTNSNDISSGFTSGGHNLVGDRAGSAGYVATDLANGLTVGLGPLADNGGATFTHALLSSSPAINATANASGTDQRNGAANGLRDIGAYERLSAHSYTVTGGVGQTATVATAYANPLEVTVIDILGGRLEGIPIVFSGGNNPTQANVAFTSPTAIATNSAGTGSISFSANNIAGAAAINTQPQGLTQTTAFVTNVADAASQFVLSGHASTVTAGNTNPFALTAQDQFGNLASGYTGTVAFSSSDTQAQLPTTSTLTGGTGSFSSELRTAGLHALTATDTLTPTLTTTQNNITVNPDRASSLTNLSGNNQQTLVNTPFINNLTVEIRDRFNNPIAGETVNFVAPSSGASAIVTPASAIFNALGQATTALSANAEAGSYLVTAVSAGLSEDFTLENTLPDSITPSAVEPPIESPVNPPVVETPGVPPIIETEVPSDSINLFLEDHESEGDREGRDELFNEIAFAQMEQSLSEEYSRYWQTPLRRGSNSERVQQILQQAENEYKSRSAVVYAVFVPPSEPEGDTEYSSLLSRRLLTNEVNNAQDELLLLLIPPEGAPIQQRVAVNRQQLQRQAQFFNIELSSFFGEGGYQALAQQMYGWLLAPIEDDIQAAGIDELMYVLDEGLSTIPLAAMMTDDTSYVVERYGLSVLPSVGLLQTDFGEEPIDQTILAGGSETFTTLESLPAVPIELAIVESAATSSQVLLNEDFSIANLQQAQTQSPKNTMHIATHAAFNPGATDRSYIQFWEEQLQLDDIANLGLSDLELLILSACTTALGSRDAELGFAGLAAATGVEASIGSLWNVSDLGTMALMAAFYEQLQTNPLRLAALQQAQLSLLNGDTRIENNRLITQNSSIPIPPELTEQDMNFSHPFFWSGFTLVGNPWW